MPEDVRYYHWPPEVFVAIADRIEELGEENVRSVRFVPPRGVHEGVLRVMHAGVSTLDHENGEDPECDPETDEDCFNFTQQCPPKCD